MFVDRQTFDKVKQGTDIPSSPYAEYIQQVDSFQTEEVRTCTAGFVKNSKTNQIAAFHIYPNFDNYVNIRGIIERILELADNPDEGILIGSKDCGTSPYSRDMFGMAKQILSKKVKGLTVFEEHKDPASETNMSYSANNDTLYIQAKYRDKQTGQFKDVSTEKELKNFYKKIKVAPNDVVIFPET